MSSQNNNPRGIVLVIIAMSLFAMQDALIKFVFEKSALYEIFFGRYVVASFLLFCFVVIAKKKVSLKTQYPFLTILRVVLHFLAFSAFFISLTFMPLATANALFFSSPFFVSIFAKFFLKEFIGIRKYTSVKDDVYTQLFYFYLISISILIVIFLIMGQGQFNNSSYDPTMQFIFRDWFSNFDYTWKFILFFGVAASVAFICIFSAYIVASPSVVSLFEYSLIIMSMIPGYLLFNEIPSIRTFIGVACIISAGVYIYFREKVRDQYIATETPVRR